jgi:hypothetical protein
MISPIRAPIPHFGGLFSTNSGKTSTIVGGIPDSLPVWLSAAELQMEITANSTYWRAKLRSYGCGVAEWVMTQKKGGL